MKVLLDTTYLLPAIGIEVDVPADMLAMVYADVLLTEAEDIPELVEFEVINLTQFDRRYL